jgi:aminobenzoyl-glutamate transport protein
MKRGAEHGKRSIDLFLGAVERIGNALPHPATIFAVFAVLVVLGSAIAASTGIEATHPGTGEVVRPVNLMTVDGLHRIVLGLIRNFTAFAPLGTVLVAMLGIGVAEGSGFIGVVLRLLVLSAPRRLITLVVVFAGVISNTASEIGYVLLVPLAGTIFLAVGRHPVAGMAAAFAGVSGGYSANLLLGTVDPLLSGLTQEAAHIISPGYAVNPACNYYFLAVSAILITVAGTWVTEKIVIPRLGKYSGEEQPDRLEWLSRDEKRGLVWASVAAALFTAVVLWGLLPEDGFLRDPETGGVLHSPFLSGIVAFIFAGAALVGIAYGAGARVFRSDVDVIRSMGKSLETLGSYMVLVFFAAQFVAFFNWTNLGLILAIKGAGLLASAGLGSVPLIAGVVLLSAVINLVIGSASAKWAIMAPVFVPMLMLLGYSPELTQAAYRVGDSVTNIISPTMSYFALVIAFFARYDRNAGMGTLIATMLPYTVVFLAGWLALLVAWYLVGLPLGPGAPLHFTG